MKRRRNSRKLTTGPGQVPTNKETIPDKKATNKSVEYAAKKTADSNKSSNENLDKDDSTERNWAKEVEYHINCKDHVSAKTNINKNAPTNVKDGLLVLSGNDCDERYPIDRKSRPFLRQARRKKNKALLTGLAKVRLGYISNACL